MSSFEKIRLGHLVLHMPTSGDLLYYIIDFQEEKIIELKYHRDIILYTMHIHK